MFHEYRETISEMKVKDKHFGKLFDKHNELDEEIAELEKSNVSYQFEIESRKKEKLKLKDEIYSLIVKYKSKNNL